MLFIFFSSAIQPLHVCAFSPLYTVVCLCVLFCFSVAISAAFFFPLSVFFFLLGILLTRYGRWYQYVCFTNSYCYAMTVAFRSDHLPAHSSHRACVCVCHVLSLYSAHSHLIAMGLSIFYVSTVCQSWKLDHFYTIIFALFELDCFTMLENLSTTATTIRVCCAVGIIFFVVAHRYLMGLSAEKGRTKQ